MVGPPRGKRLPMGTPPPRLPRPQVLAQRVFETLQRFLHVEAVSGIVLLLAAFVAMIWANSSFAQSYEALWKTPISIGLGTFVFSKALHFWINDILMTVFFLVVGMEIRREIHEGALNNLRQAALPIAAALGGVIVPALIYIAINTDPITRQGWAVPTATDIAFAVGILALLGRSIPVNIRVFLLALAIIDDVIAVLIIAFRYSGSLSYDGFAVAGLGLLVVLGLQRDRSWFSLRVCGPRRDDLGWSADDWYAPNHCRGCSWTDDACETHPDARTSGGHGDTRGKRDKGVSGNCEEHPSDGASAAATSAGQPRNAASSCSRTISPAPLGLAYGVMPLFALANAGVSLSGVDLSSGGSQLVMSGVAIAFSPPASQLA